MINNEGVSGESNSNPISLPNNKSTLSTHRRMFLPAQRQQSSGFTMMTMGDRVTDRRLPRPDPRMRRTNQIVTGGIRPLIPRHNLRTSSKHMPPASCPHSF